jgi:hypothetical protein
MNQPEFRAREQALLVRDYASLMDPTPRGVKRTLVAFWLNRALAQSLFGADLPSDEAIMAWTIIALRWPTWASRVADEGIEALANEASAKGVVGAREVVDFALRANVESVARLMKS